MINQRTDQGKNWQQLTGFPTDQRKEQVLNSFFLHNFFSRSLFFFTPILFSIFHSGLSITSQQNISSNDLIFFFAMLLFIPSSCSISFLLQSYYYSLPFLLFLPKKKNTDNKISNHQPKLLMLSLLISLSYFDFSLFPCYIDFLSFPSAKKTKKHRSKK